MSFSLFGPGNADIAADASLTLIVADPSTHTEGDASDDRQITIFRTKAELEAFPFEVGRPVLFRNLKVSTLAPGQ